MKLLIKQIMRSKIIGIYKITNPNGRIYIGQSIDISYRINKYKRLNCVTQRKLYRSLNKYGFCNHKIEIIEECSPVELNDKERYYQELYNSINKGLNCVYQKTSIKKQRVSDETKRRISESTKGRFFSKETKRRISESLKGKKRTKEHSDNISKSVKGKKRKPHSSSTIQKLIDNNKNSKLVLDTNTGVFYNSCSELSKLTGIKYSTLNSWLSGQTEKETQYVRV